MVFWVLWPHNQLVQNLVLLNTLPGSGAPPFGQDTAAGVELLGQDTWGVSWGTQGQGQEPSSLPTCLPVDAGC